MTDRSRYARAEREQRWLVAHMPDGAVRKDADLISPLLGSPSTTSFR